MWTVYQMAIIVDVFVYHAINRCQHDKVTIMSTLLPTDQIRMSKTVIIFQNLRFIG